MLLAGEITSVAKRQANPCSGISQMGKKEPESFCIDIRQSDGNTIFIVTSDPRAPEVFKFGATIEIEIKE